MGKRLPKKELLAEIATERELLIELLETIPVRQFTVKGMNSADWSIKDVLTHLLGWEKRVVQWCEAGLRGETPEVPGDGFKWNETRHLNALIKKRHQRMSVKTTREQLDAIHKETLRLINALSNKQLTTLNAFGWTGNSWTVSDYFRGNTASHYRWARNKIKKWLAKLNS